MKQLKQTWVLSVLAIATVLSVAGCRDPHAEKGWATKPITQAYTFPARGPDGEVLEALQELTEGLDQNYRQLIENYFRNIARDSQR